MGFHRTLVSTLGALVIFTSAAAQGPGALDTFTLSIPAEPLADSLNALAQQSGLQVLFSSQIVDGLRGPQVKGAFSAEDALRKLLDNTNLRFELVNAHTIAIMVKPATGSKPAGASPELGSRGSIGPQSPGKSPRTTDNKQGVREVSHQGLFARLFGLFAVCGSALNSGAACAQQVDATNNADTLQEVVVTGSRVITNGNDSPTPVTVVTTQDLQAIKPTTLFEALETLPAFTASTDATSTPAGAGGNPTNVSALNLRGLGAQRTLVMYDSHRLSPTTGNGQVDVNLIPQMLIQRVDVVTGGASAVYGSDAIAGVVNFVTDRRFDGVKIDAQFGRSGYNDDPSHNMGIALGTELFGGRGHLEGSFNLHDDSGIPRRTDRPLQTDTLFEGGGTAANPYFLARGVTESDTAFGGVFINKGPQFAGVSNYYFASNGVLSPFVYGNSTNFNGLNMQGGSGAVIDASSLKAQSDMKQLFARFDFDITDNLHYFLTTTGVREHSHDSGFNYQLHFEQISTGNGFGPVAAPVNAFLPAAVQAALGPHGPPFIFFGKVFSADQIPPSDSDIVTGNLYFNTGLEGKLGAYKWETSVTHEVTQLDTSMNNQNLERLSAALDAVLDPATGTVVCHVTLTNPGLYPGCVPLNPFGPSSVTKSAVQYIQQQTYTHSTAATNDLEGSFSGSPFHDWAGPVDMALSGQWRRQTYEQDGNASPAPYLPVDCTGLLFNCQNRVYDTSVYPQPLVSENNTEEAFEANVPLLKNVPLVQAADLNVAFRHAGYSVSGTPILGESNITRKFDANTWKVGLTWRINDSIGVRAARSRDFRAPNLTELYQAATFNNFNAGQFTDLLLAPGLQQYATSGQGGGNPSLFAEYALTNTAGIVLSPTEKFSASIDYFDIQIRNDIQTVAGWDPANQRACYASGGTSIFCTLQVRPLGYADTTAANQVSLWYTEPLNVAEVETYGADVEVNFKSEINGHPFSLRAFTTYQPHAIYQVPGLVTDAAGVGNNSQEQGGAVWRANATASYSLFEGFTAGYSIRWRSALHPFADPTLVVAPGSDHIGSAAFSSLNLSYDVKLASASQLNVYLNVQNLFDRLPPVVAPVNGSPGQAGGFAPGDDVVGRYFLLGVRYRM